jgi:branched-subunit amino acid permease
LNGSNTTHSMSLTRLAGLIIASSAYNSHIMFGIYYSQCPLCLAVISVRTNHSIDNLFVEEFCIESVPMLKLLYGSMIVYMYTQYYTSLDVFYENLKFSVLVLSFLSLNTSPIIFLSSYRLFLSPLFCLISGTRCLESSLK